MIYSFKLLVISVVTVPAALLIVLLGIFDRYGKHVYGITRLWSWMVLMAGGVGLKVTGLSHIDPKRQYIFMANHQSHIDIPILIQSLPAFQLRWIAKRELLWVPFFGWAMWAAKHITVDRSDRMDALGSLKKAKERMKSGISLVIFPEGTRSSNGHLLPFKRGGLFLGARPKPPAVPAQTTGSWAILPKGDRRLRRGQIELPVKPPVSVKNYRPGTLRALSADVQELIENNLQSASQFKTPKSGETQSMTAAGPSMEKRTV